MKVFLSIVISIVVYFVGGAIAWDIYLSSWKPSDQTILFEIISRRVLCYAILAASYNLLCLYKSNEGQWLLLPAAPIASWYVQIHVLPPSEGMDLLNVIICVASMIFASCIFAGDED